MDKVKKLLQFAWYFDRVTYSSFSSIILWVVITILIFILNVNLFCINVCRLQYNYGQDCCENKKQPMTRQFSIKDPRFQTTEKKSKKCDYLLAVTTRRSLYLLIAKER